MVGEVFRAPVPGVRLARHDSVMEGLRAGIAGELAVLDDAGLTGTGRRRRCLVCQAWCWRSG